MPRRKSSTLPDDQVKPTAASDAAPAESPVAVDGPGGAASSIASAGGEASSVTRLAHFTSVAQLPCLTCGIDTLDLGLSVAWGDSWNALSESLAESKERAAGTIGVLSADGRYLIAPAGKPPNFRWHLIWPDFHLFLGKSPQPHQKTPNVYASINSRTLWESPLSLIVDRVRSEIERLGGAVLAIKPSRCDLAADFRIPGGLTLNDILTHRVPHQVRHSNQMQGAALETFYQGAKKSPIQLRIYDKGLEIAHGGTKWWFLQVWRTDSAEDVWRVEFQLRRKTLKQFSINTVEELQAQLGGLWRYLTEDWFLLRLRDDSNTTRRTVHPWWRAVQACAEGFGVVQTVVRRFTGEPADSAWYVSHGAGCLASFAAREGIDDFKSAALLYVSRMGNYWSRRDFPKAVAAKSLHEGFPERSNHGLEPDRCGRR